MPNMKDAPVLLSGRVITTAIVPHRETKAYDGRKVTVMVEGDAEPGFAVVKLSADEGSVYNPQPGELITWYVRSAPYAVGDNTGMSTRFIREVIKNDLDQLLGQLKASA